MDIIVSSRIDRALVVASSLLLALGSLAIVRNSETAKLSIQEPPIEQAYIPPSVKVERTATPTAILPR